MALAVILVMLVVMAVVGFAGLKAQDLLDSLVSDTEDSIRRKAGPVAASAFVLIACGLMFAIEF